MGGGEGCLQQCTSREKDSFCLLKKTTTLRLSTVLTILGTIHYLCLGGWQKRRGGRGEGHPKI